MKSIEPENYTYSLKIDQQSQLPETMAPYGLLTKPVTVETTDQVGSKKRCGNLLVTDTLNELKESTPTLPNR